MTTMKENYERLLHKYFQIKDPSFHSIETLCREFESIKSYIDVENCNFLLDNYNDYHNLLL